MYSASPLRIVKPQFENHNSGFIVYSGVTQYAEPISKLFYILLRLIINKILSKRLKLSFF